MDIGGSTTKIVGFSPEGELLGTVQVRATDQLTSMYGAIGNFLHTYSYSLDQVGRFVLTGVGATLVEGDVYGKPTCRVEELQAIGHGGLRLAGVERALVVSMGTGTAYVRADGEKITHLGGSGVGGGTLLGLSEKLFREYDFSMITALAQEGNLDNVDLAIRDISRGNVSTLPPNLTASNFGKIKSTATRADMAYGLINMIYQTIGMLAVFACLDSPIRDVVLTGTLTTLPQAKENFDILGNLHNINFILPEHAVFATAIGAAVPFLEG